MISVLYYISVGVAGKCRTGIFRPLGCQT